jgi:hypothetical protein
MSTLTLNFSQAVGSYDSGVYSFTTYTGIVFSSNSTSTPYVYTTTNTITNIADGEFAYSTQYSSQLIFLYLIYAFIPLSVIQIGNGGFGVCQNLVNVVFEGTKELTPELRFLGGVFNNTGLTSIILPNRLVSFNGDIFISCTSLNKIVFPENSLFTNIPGNSCLNCSSLTTIVINSNVLTIVSNAFNNTPFFTNTPPGVYNSTLYTDSTYSQAYTYFSTRQNVKIIIPYPCFKEGSKILTDQGYKFIQDLRKGDLVKTLLHGYLPIDMIGKREIYHSASKERIKDQLYQCSQDHFEEIFEPLIITGCHSILVDSFVSEKERERVIEVNGNTYVTDGKYRLPACANERVSVYEISGNYTIYHLALENNDYYMNYGIYANGLLVETCSKRYLKELSNMTLF